MLVFIYYYCQYWGTIKDLQWHLAVGTYTTFFSKAHSQCPAAWKSSAASSAAQCSLRVRWNVSCDVHNHRHLARRNPLKAKMLKNSWSTTVQSLHPVLSYIQTLLLFWVEKLDIPVAAMVHAAAGAVTSHQHFFIHVLFNRGFSCFLG